MRTEWSHACVAWALLASGCAAAPGASDGDAAPAALDAADATDATDDAAPGDGELDAPDAAADSADALGAPPTVRAAISPAKPTRVTGVTVDVSLLPAAHGFVPHWHWDGPAVVADDTPTLSTPTKGDHWTVRAWATRSDGARVDASPVDVTIGDAPPSAPVLAVVPAGAKTGDPLSATSTAAATDPDGDALALAWSWDVDGAATAFTTAAIPAGTIKGGQRWRVHAIAHEVASPSVVGPEATATLVVGLLAPSAPVVSITPAAPTPGAALHADLTTPSVDPNGLPISYAWSWTRNGVATTTASADVPGAAVKAHDAWTVSVVASDGTLSSAAAVASVAVANRPPSITSVALSPAIADTTTPIVASYVASDPDGDPLRVAVRWLVSGVPIAGATTTTLAPGSARRGNGLTAEITVDDGMGGSATATSATLTIANAPPAPPVAAHFAPAFPRAGQSSTLVAAAGSDPDGDSTTLEIEWSLGDVVQPTDVSALRSPTDLKRGVWTARVASYDGTARSAWVVVPGTLTLCPSSATWPSQPSDFKANYWSAWDPRSCKAILGDLAVDGETLAPVASPLWGAPASGESIDFRAWLEAKPTADAAHGTISLSFVTPYGAPFDMSGLPSVRTDDLPPYPWLTARVSASGIQRTSAEGVVVYALFDGVATNKQRFMSLYRGPFGQPFTLPELPTTHVDLDPTGLPSFDNVFSSFYYPPTDELVIGPVTGSPVDSEWHIWAIGVHTGAKRKVWHALDRVGWQWDPWIGALVAFVPRDGYGVGRMDPATGAATWTPSRAGLSIRSAPIAGDRIFATAVAAAPVVVPATGDTLGVTGAGLMQLRGADGALRDVSPFMDLSRWGTDPVNNWLDVVARTATGTAIAYSMSPEGGYLAMARVAEVDPTTGSSTWLTPSSASAVPDPTFVPAIAYEPTTDSLLVHGGGHEGRIGVGDTWSFALASRTWSRIATGGPAREYASLVVDAPRRRALLYGGVAPPLYPSPSWQHELWSLDLVTGTWSLVDSSSVPALIASATIAVDPDGSKVYAFAGQGQICGVTGCWVNQYLLTFDFASKKWTTAALPQTGPQPGQWLYTDSGYSNFWLSTFRASPAHRAFVYAGSACDGVDVVGTGLLTVSWDDPASGYRFAMTSASAPQHLAYAAVDDTRSVVGSIWPHMGNGGCYASSASYKTTLLAWP